MEATSNIILSQVQIQHKLRRMAYEIYEYNDSEKEIILAGIWDRGYIIAEHLKKTLEEIASFEVKLIRLDLDKVTPGEVKVSPETDFSGKVVVLVDDVANSGRTLLVAMKPLLQKLPRKIQTAVLVDRMHKTFPVVADYIGYSLSTTLQDMIMVEMKGNEIVSAYLEG